MLAVCIPSIGGSGPMLQDLVKVCVAEPDVSVVEVWDNVGTCLPVKGAAKISGQGMTIYQEFNKFASMYGAHFDLAYLNDDIVLLPGDLTKLASALGEYGLVSGTDTQNGRGVRAVTGSYRQGGIRSWAFVVGQGLWPAEGIDERFKIWYGDDDLFWKMRKAGHRLGVHEEVFVEHRHSMTLHQMDWVPQAQVDDTKLWQEMGRP